MDNNNKYYSLEVKKQEVTDCFRIFLEADSNDGDYIGRETIISREQFEGVAVHELRILNQFYSGRHEFENFSSDMITIPYSDWGSCHSLNDLTIEYTDKEGKIYDVKLSEFTEDELRNISDKYGDDYMAYAYDLCAEYYNK